MSSADFSEGEVFDEMLLLRRFIAERALFLLFKPLPNDRFLECMPTSG